MSKHRTRHPRTNPRTGPRPGESAGPWSGPGRGGQQYRRARGAPFPQPVALAVAADRADFERLGRHRLFGAADHPGYLRRTESQLRALRGQGLDVHLRLLDAAGYEDFCAERLLDPGDQVARVAYAADPEYLGEPFVYAGERLAELLPALVDDHLARVRISVGCARLLGAVEDAERPEERLAELLEYTAEVYLALAAGAGTGSHRLRLSCEGPGGEEVTAEAGLRAESARLAVAGRDAEAFCVTLAAALAGHSVGELLLHSADPGGGGPSLRGWALSGGRLRPMTALEVRAVPPEREAPEAEPSETDGSARPPAEPEAGPGFPLPEQPGRGPRAARGG